MYLLTGVADKEEFADTLKRFRSPIKVVNMFSKEDKVLKHLLGCSMEWMDPIGLGKIQMEKDEDNYYELTNIDCTDVIGGHCKFTQKYLGVISMLLNMEEQ